jgi:hypothetical protein
MGKHKSYRALAELDETQLSNLSEHGLRVSTWDQACRA